MIWCRLSSPVHAYWMVNPVKGKSIHIRSLHLYKWWCSPTTSGFNRQYGSKMKPMLLGYGANCTVHAILSRGTMGSCFFVHCTCNAIWHIVNSVWVLGNDLTFPEDMGRGIHWHAGKTFAVLIPVIRRDSLPLPPRFRLICLSNNFLRTIAGRWWDAFLETSHLGCSSVAQRHRYPDHL